MLGLTRVNHIGLRVGDFETSRDFYAKLGFHMLQGRVDQSLLLLLSIQAVLTLILF